MSKSKSKEEQRLRKVSTFHSREEKKAAKRKSHDYVDQYLEEQDWTTDQSPGYADEWGYETNKS